MAGGNMGDLSFSLTLKSRIEEETKKITKELNKIDATGKQAQNALEAISEATKGIGDKGGRSFEKLNTFVKELRRNIAVFSSEDFFSPKKLQQLESVQDGLYKIGRILGEVSKEGAGFNIFPNSVATEANKAKRELYKLSSFIDEINKRHGEGIQLFGVDSTNNIRQSLSELSKYRTELEQIRNNGGIHPITGLTASDVVNSAGYLNAKDEAKSYAKVVKDAILERYKAEQDAEKKRKKDEADAAREAKANEKQRQAEIKNTERRYDSLGNKVRQLRSEFSRGISIGADVNKTEAEIHRLISIMRLLQNLKDNLSSPIGWKGYLGQLGNIGSGHDTTLASRVLQDQRAVNSEVQRGVELEQKRQQEIAQSAARARNDLAAAFAGANAEAKKMQSIVGDIKSLFLQGGIVFGAQQFFNSIVQTGGEIVQQHVALRSILGDVQKADELFAQTQQLALQSPFKFGELNRDVKQLAAFGVEANDLYDTTKRLADIASGLGVSFERLGLAYGQVKARSWLDGKELRQFAYAGLPLLQKITDLYNSEGKNGRTNYTNSDVKKMISNREVSFEDVQKVLWKLTDEGGQFYNMQFVLSETLLGKWNKLIDAWDIMLGRFADGKNVVGGTFKFLIDSVTNLVLMIDKLSPALLAFGGMLALRKGAGAIAAKTGIASELTALRAAQQLELRRYMVEQNRLVLEGQITREQATQNIMTRGYLLADTQTKMNAMEKLAIEGKLSLLQMQKAVREGLISKELIRQLEIMGLISAKQSELITKEGTRARMSLAVNQAKGKLGGFFSGWNIATLGVTIGAALYSAYSQFKDSIKQDTDRINETAKTTVKTLSDTLSEVGNKGTGETLQQQVDKMTDVLKQSGLYTDSIKEQIDSTDDLGKEYDILKQKIIDARNENNFTPGEGENFAKAKKASGAGFVGGASWFGQWTGIGQDDIDENINDVAENLTQLQMKMEKFGDSTKSSMEKVANSMLGARAAGMTFEEKLYTLYTTGGKGAATWRLFVDKVSNGNKDMKGSLENLEDDLRHFGANFSEIATDDIPKYLEYMAKSRNMDMVEFSRWCKQHPDKFRTMLDQMLSEANKKVPGLVARLQSVAMAILNIGKAKPQEGYTGPKVWKNPNKVGTIERKAFDKLQKAGKLKGNKGGFWQKEMAEYLHNLNGGNSNGWTSFGEAVRKRYKEVRDENDNAKNAGDRQPYVREQRMLEAIAAQSGISLDVGKNKVTGHFGKGKNKNGREEDTELKRLQERLSSLKSARQMYQKYKSIMSDEEAKKKTYNLFPEVTGLNLDDYQKAVHSLLEGFSINTTERKKFQTSIYREVAEWLFDEKDKKEYERKAADFTELLNRLSSQWDLYKELFSKTGDKNFSSAAFSNPGYIDDKAKELIVEYNNKFGKDFQRENAMSMSDGVAKETLKGPGEYEAWKKIVDLLRNNYIKILQDAADIIEKTEDYEDKILKIRERYNELISKTNDPGIKARYEIQRDKEIGQVKLDKFKNSSDYLNFYGAIVSLGMDKAQTIGARIRQNIYDALQSGAIDAREYAKEIKQLDEQLSKLEKLRPSFLNGGLEGIVNAKKERANDMITLGSSQYNKAKEDFNKAKINDDLDGMAAAANSKAAGEKMMEGGEKLLKGASKMSSTISMIDTIIHGINDIVQGANDTFQDIKSTASALGIDTESDGWTDANSFFEGFSSSSASATKAWESLKSGNVGGVVSGVVGSFTGWIKAFSAGHDAKLDRQIKLAERQLNELKNLSSNISSVIEKTLGGIYSYNRSSDANKKLNDVKNDYKAWDTFSKTDIGKNFFGGHNFSHYSKETYDAVMKTETNPSAYADQLALLHAQEDELRKQRQAEEDKKKTDKDKIADYDQQIKEMQLQIKTFAQDFLKDVYSIDMKSWASTLTDTIVSAWAKGEDAVDAYKKKVKDMVRDVTKNIVSQKIMEKALEEPLKWLTGVLDEKGQLDETDMDTFAKKLNKAGEKVTPLITGIFDAMKNNGFDMREDGSSSVTNSIKGITEETADLLASYLNSIRLYCAEDNANLKQLTELTKSTLPEISVIAKSQLTAMNQLVTLAEYRNGRLDDMYSWMRSITKETGARSIRIN
nr:MAG TPA: tail tape measure protein [Caudoviricetes sp.]